MEWIASLTTIWIWTNNTSNMLYITLEEIFEPIFDKQKIC